MIFIAVDLNLGLFLETARKEIFDDIANSQVHDGRFEIFEERFSPSITPRRSILKDKQPGWMRKTRLKFRSASEKNSHTGLHCKSAQLSHELRLLRPPK